MIKSAIATEKLRMMALQFSNCSTQVNGAWCKVSLSTIVLNSRDQQGMYGMQHFRTPIETHLTIGFSPKTDLNALAHL